MKLVDHSDPILNPSMVFSSFEIREPITSLTDFLVALTAMYAVYRFFSYKGEKSEHYNTYRTYFIFLAIGMTSAAFLGHAFQAYISPRWKSLGWMLSSTGQLFLVIATINQMGYKWSLKLRRNIKTLVFLKYITFISLVLIPATSSFKLVQVNSTLDLVFTVLPLQFIFYRDHKMTGTLVVISALIYAMIPGMVYTNELSVDRWFNYHDISHVMMAIFVFFMFFGTFKMATDPKHIELTKIKN